MDNQIRVLNKLAVNRRDEERRELIKETVQKLETQKKNILSIRNDETVNNVRNSLLGYEGTAGRVYFETLGKLIPEKYAFESRSRNPALDPFNCMLNYAYGILYPASKSLYYCLTDPI